MFIIGASLPTALDQSITVIGSHGVEMSVSDLLFDCGAELKKLKAKLIDQFADSLDLEIKRLSLAVHYREHKDPQGLLQELNQVAKDFSDTFRVQEGLMVFEFVPKKINKSLAINYLTHKFLDYLPVYFGDDLTDCFAFNRINEINGLSVQIGDRIESQADYGLDSVEDLYALIAA